MYPWIPIQNLESNLLVYVIIEIESKCLQGSRVGLLRNGWLVLDRVIDAPVSQDILTWKDQMKPGFNQSID